jgi:hypothetical protein
LINSLVAKVTDDLIDESTGDYIKFDKVLKKSNSIYLVGSYWGWKDKNDKENNPDDYTGKYDFIAKFNITPDGLVQKNFVSLGKFNSKLLNGDNDSIYLIENTSNGQKLYIFDNNLNEIASCFLKGNGDNYGGYTADPIVIGKKLYVPYDNYSGLNPAHGFGEIDVSDLNNIKEKIVNIGSINKFLKDNGIIYGAGDGKLYQFDNNMSLRKIHDFNCCERVIAVKNDLAILSSTSLDSKYSYKLYKLNDDNSTTFVSGTNSIKDLDKILFVDNDKFYYPTYSNKIVLGSVKAYDSDFDGEFDYEDTYKGIIKNEILHLNTGWNMVGALTTLNLNQNITNAYSKLFNLPNMIAYKWDKDENSWDIYSTMDINVTLPKMKIIEKGEGFWVKLNTNFDLNVSNFNDENYMPDINSGWNLVSVMKDEKVDEIASKTNAVLVWQYDGINNKWKVYSPDYGLNILLNYYYQKGRFEKLKDLKKGSAVWIFEK